MSVTIAANQQPSTFWQRLTGTEPKTIVKETSTTTITSDPGGSFDIGTALRNGGIGAAVAGVLGGVSLLGKVALPMIGKIATVGGLVKLAGVGGALGVATAALPLLAPKIKESPAAKAALIGAGIGAAAGAVLPLVPMWLGASVGAGVGLLVNHSRNRSYDYPVYPGYTAYPGYQPMGMHPGAHVPSGMVQVTPNYGGYAATAMNPYGNVGGYGMVPAGYGAGMPMGGYGYGQGMVLPAQAQAQPQVQGQVPVGGQVPAGAVAMPAAAAAANPAPAASSTPSELPPVGVKSTKASKAKNPNAKTFKDGQGNIRQIGTGKIVKPSATSQASAAQAAAAAVQAAATPPVQGGFVTSYGLDGGTSPLPTGAAQMVASGVQPTALPQLPGM